MGQTLRNLSRRRLKKNGIFDQRFVVELCEKMHVHYRNIRFLMSQKDWKSMMIGCSDSIRRWAQMDMPEAGNGKHIELCRKPVAMDVPDEEEMLINLNNNLYRKYKGKIFSEGSELEDEVYIHFKYRDIRIELTLNEFREMAEMFSEAKEKLEKIHEPEKENSGLSSVL